MTMTRRKLLQRMGQISIASRLSSNPLSLLPHSQQPSPDQPSPEQLDGTHPLTFEGDLAAQMVEGIGKYLSKATAASVGSREEFWHRGFSSLEAYEKSVEPNRERFSKAIGLLDGRISYDVPEIVDKWKVAEVLAEGSGYRVYAVRWPVLPGVDAEGLLLEPSEAPVARLVALPDADWAPEALVGLARGLPTEAQFARRLAENGAQVLVPTLIDREDTWSGNSSFDLFTNMTHREFIYRMAYELGRHIIGYEVQKVLAAVDWFSRSEPTRPVGVIGYGEGGLLALYSAAVDTRVKATMVSGYFQSRQGLSEEPLYRNVWTLLREFGDAEVASLIAPRGLVVEASRGPEIAGPPPAGDHRLDFAAPGCLASPVLKGVREEVGRTRPFFAKLGADERLALIVSGSDGQGAPGSEQALREFLGLLGVRKSLKSPGPIPVDRREKFDPAVRLHRQFNQLVDFTQAAVRGCEEVRRRFWSKADSSSVAKWKQSTEGYRRYLWEEVLGKLPEAPLPLTASTRKIYEEPNWTGYEVLLPLWPEFYAYGILLLPKKLARNERRPVVVCQHGLESRPQDLIKPTADEHYYHEFAADLVNHGFVVYCPQNPYIGGVKFRQLQRMANPLKLSLFSFILSQHQRTLAWLAQQPFVDSERIGFYGLSYGGKTAVRVPPLLDQYCLAICAGDFNEWIWKVSRNDAPFTYVYTYEYEMPEFGIGNYFNHSEMANLMTPRPFMVERGHRDGVSVDPWVAYEYAKVRRHYDELNLSDRTRIEYFNGPHTIHAVGTFEFLHHFLQWGEPFGS